MKKKKAAAVKHISLRIDEELLRKFGYIANYQDRSMNWMVLNLISKAVKSFEDKHGPIELEEPEDEAN